MKYIVTAVVRFEGDTSGETWPETFIGDVKEWHEPARLAHIGVSDLNARRRKEDPKMEIVGVTWFKAENIAPYIGTVINKYIEVTAEAEALSVLENTLDSACMDIYNLTSPPPVEEEIIIIEETVEEIDIDPGAEGIEYDLDVDDEVTYVEE